MRTISTLLAVILVATGALKTQTVEVFTTRQPAEPRTLYICGGHRGCWMTLNRADTKAPEQRGFDPSYTFIMTDLVPMVRKVGDKYEITFRSDIAKALP